jgi:hypothetical protein
MRCGETQMAVPGLEVVHRITPQTPGPVRRGSNRETPEAIERSNEKGRRNAAPFREKSQVVQNL